MIEVEGEEISYDKDELQNALLSYYDKSLTRYVKEYNVGFYYYNISDGSMCLEDKCNAVEVSVNCKLILSYDYKRVMYYQLKGNHHG